ncbi:ABC-type transport auxiliary lipoprotein family protein [Marinobacter koreensis]|uniref:ABC-type transport auxiliary lipoprotein family protein n=2 Tax=Marinobacter koreensis TaxID=335974 RepID=A0ABW0RJY2_9GAMM|nr:ABC-type transport auxiliary lipoprotein family protein [Marinobacter koreensis]MCK7548330.1 ABC-type transport auxiliary lipoprotein family protein [Marinobacter koreensis]
MKRVLATLSMATLVTACTVFPASEPPRVMDLARAQDVSEMPGKARPSIRIDTPLASDPINSTLILSKPTPLEFQSYPGARWRDSAPVLVRDYLVDTLRRSQGFQYVVTDTSPASVDLTLISELSDFQSEQTETGMVAVIGLHTEILDNQSRKVLCIHDERVKVPASGRELDAVVAAFGEAARSLSTKTLNWLGGCEITP